MRKGASSGYKEVIREIFEDHYCPKRNAFLWGPPPCTALAFSTNQMVFLHKAPRGSGSYIYCVECLGSQSSLNFYYLYF